MVNQESTDAEGLAKELKDGDEIHIRWIGTDEGEVLKVTSLVTFLTETTEIRDRGECHMSPFEVIG